MTRRYPAWVIAVLLLSACSSGSSQTARLTLDNPTWDRVNVQAVITNSADVAAIERDTGKVKWVTPLTQYADEKRREPILWAGPVLASDRLLVAGSTGDLLALSPYTGEVIGKIAIGSSVRIAPVVANRTIFILADSGRLIALR